MREGLFLAEGVRVVEDLLDARIVPRLALLSSSLGDTARGRALAERLRAACDTDDVSDAELADLADTETTQGVLVAAEIPSRTLDAVRPGPAHMVLMLDAIQDPGNAGTLMRTAEAMGCLAVLALPGTVDAWNPKVVRAAAGSLFRLPPVECDVDAVADWIARHGASVLAGDARGEPIDRVALRGPVVLAVSNEGAGLSDAVARMTATRVAIPMRGNAESLNVGAAAAILLYETSRRLAAEGAS